MKLLKWAAILIVGFLALRWLINVLAPVEPPQIGDGSIYNGWGFAGPLYARAPLVRPWSPRPWRHGRRDGTRTRDNGPRPWRGESYAGKG